MFRFTIRDVLWVTVVVGLAVGWWLNYRGQRAQLRHEKAGHQLLARFLTQQGYKVSWSDENTVLTILPPGDH